VGLVPTWSKETGSVDQCGIFLRIGFHRSGLADVRAASTIDGWVVEPLDADDLMCGCLARSHPQSNDGPLRTLELPHT
jgi:hypothetical protein